jgi:hypothetical protein
LRQTEHARQEFTTREISRGAEEDDDVVVRDKVLLGGHGRSPLLGSTTARLGRRWVRLHHATQVSPCVISA